MVVQGVNKEKPVSYKEKECISKPYMRGRNDFLLEHSLRRKVLADKKRSS
jgi:hypothetical protein